LRKFIESRTGSETQACRSALLRLKSAGAGMRCGLLSGIPMGMARGSAPGC
jgi:hypothetical protein